MHQHTPEAVAKRIAAAPRHNYLRDWVYGGIDGAITTFAVVASVIGAALSIKVILVLGIANLLADGFSMAAGNYISTRAEEEEYRHREAMEYDEIETEPEGEVEEVRQIYLQKGFKGEMLEKIVALITSDKKLWVDTMIREEFGMPAEIRSPLKAASSTFAAFILFGLIPLVPFLLLLPNSFLWASVFTGVAFFIIGSLKSRWSINAWWHSGLVTLFVGTLAASIAYVVGYLFKLYVLG